MFGMDGLLGKASKKQKKDWTWCRVLIGVILMDDCFFNNIWNLIFKTELLQYGLLIGDERQHVGQVKGSNSKTLIM